MNTEAIAIGIAISAVLLWWLDRSIGAVYPRWSTSYGRELLRRDLVDLRDGWRRQPREERITVTVMVAVVGTYALAIIVATLT